MKPALIAETERLRIRRMTTDDAGFILNLVNQPSFLEHIGNKGVKDLEDAKRFILAGPWTQHADRGFGQFVVELRDGSEPVGVCGVLFRESLDVCDIGCAFLPAYWRRGYAFESAMAVMEYGRTTLAIDTIVGLTSEENIASIKALEKLGMSFERMVKMSDDDPGTALYS